MCRAYSLLANCEKDALFSWLTQALKGFLRGKHSWQIYQDFHGGITVLIAAFEIVLAAAFVTLACINYVSLVAAFVTLNVAIIEAATFATLAAATFVTLAAATFPVVIIAASAFAVAT